MKIRHALEEDCEEIAKVLVSGYNMKSVGEAKEVFMKEKDAYTYIIAEENEIKGLVTWKMHGTPKHGLCELNRIVVLPGSRNNGVGKLLFDALVKDAETFFLMNGEKLRKIFLFAHESNEVAEKFYRSVGFTKEAVLKDHYYDGVNEVVFSLFV